MHSFFQTLSPARPAIIVPSVDLTTGLLSAWEFDEIAGTTATDSHSTRNLSLSNVTVDQTGKLDRACLFNGTTSMARWLTDNQELNPLTGQTISAWIYRNGNGTNSWGAIATKYWSTTNQRQMYFILNDNNTLQAAYYDSSNVGTTCVYVPPSNIWTGAWNHVVYTRSGSAMKIYVNGTLVQSSSGGNGNARHTNGVFNYFTVGATTRSTTTPDWFFNGLIDQVAVWNHALDQTKIDAIYNSGNGLAYTSW